MQRHGQGARDGRGRHDQHVGGGIPFGQRQALAHPEALLLVDHHQAERLELHAFLDQGVGAHHHPGLAASHPRARFVSPPPRRRPDQDLHCAGQPGQELAGTPGVLFGEDLGRRHQRGLVPAFHGQQHREERHQRLPGTDIALQHAIHAVGRGHVGVDLSQHAHLRPGEGEGEALVQRPDEAVGALEDDAGAHARGAVANPCLEQLEQEEFVEGKAAPGGVGAVE